MTMKPPPPTPHEKGSATPRTPAAATAASTAFPPGCSASIAACVASVSTLAAAPPLPVEVGGPDGATAAAATPTSTRNEETSAAVTRNLRMVSPFDLETRTYTIPGVGSQVVRGAQRRQIRRHGNTRIVDLAGDCEAL